MVEDGALTKIAKAVEREELSLFPVEVSGSYEEPVLVAQDWPDDK